MQAQEKASEREERRKAGSPVEAGSWAWNEEFHDCHRFREALSGQKRFLECILERRARVRLFFHLSDGLDPS